MGGDYAMLDEGKEQKRKVLKGGVRGYRTCTLYLDKGSR